MCYCCLLQGAYTYDHVAMLPPTKGPHTQPRINAAQNKGLALLHVRRCKPPATGSTAASLPKRERTFWLCSLELAGDINSGNSLLLC